MIVLDKLKKVFEENAIARYDSLFLHIWGEKGLEEFVKPPVYKLAEYDLTIDKETEMVLQWIKENKSKDEIKKLLDENKISEERYKLILEKIKDREKLKHILEEKGLPVDLDEWKTEIWAGKGKNGWLVWKYRVEQGNSMLSKFSQIPYKDLDPSLLLKISMALNALLLLFMILLGAGYYYPMITYYLFSIITARDMFWMFITITLIYIMVSIKLREKVFYANWIYIDQETVTLPIVFGKAQLTARVFTLYLYQSDAIPPAQVDVILWNTDELKKILDHSYFRDYLAALKESQKYMLENKHLKDQINVYKDTIDTYQNKYDEVKALYYNLGIQTRSYMNKLESTPFPIREVLKIILILGVVGIIGYAIAQITQSQWGAFILMAFFGFIVLLIIVMIIKYATTRVEYTIYKGSEVV